MKKALALSFSFFALANMVTVNQVHALSKKTTGTIFGGVSAVSALATIYAAREFWRSQDSSFGPALTLLSALTLTCGLASISLLESR